MKKISLIPIGSGLASIAFLPLLAAKCADTNGQSKENTKQSLHSVIKTTELGELPRKDLDSIKSALSVKNPNLKINELAFKIDENENKVIVKANENSTLYTGEIVINYSIKSQNELAPGLDNKTYFESKLKELTEKISNAKKDVLSTVDINSGAKINKEKFNMVYHDVTMKMEEYGKEVSNLEKSLEIFNEKVRRNLSNLLLKLSNMYRNTKLEIENIAEKSENPNHSNAPVRPPVFDSDTLDAQTAWNALQALWDIIKNYFYKGQTYEDVIEFIKNHDYYKKFASFISLSPQSHKNEHPESGKRMTIIVKDGKKSISFNANFGTVK